MARIIGVLGGTFDPPHSGHLLLAKRAYVDLDLDSVFWVVTPYPPHKTDRPISPLSARIQMVEQCIHSIPAFELSSADSSRPAPHYAVGTMQWLRDHHPGRKFAYLMGSDSLLDLPNWHTPAAFVELCDKLAVMHRMGSAVDLEGLEEKLPGISSKIVFLEGAKDEISAFAIRERIRTGDGFDELVPQGVAEIIEHLGLYN